MKHSVDIELCSRLYEEGQTLRQLAVSQGVPARTLHRYLKTAGVTLRNPGNPMIAKLQDAEWLKAKYRDEELSTTQIALELGCEASLVSQYLRRHGIEARSVGSEKGHDRMTPEVAEKISKARRGRFLGAENPNWKGGIDRRDPERYRYPARKWSLQVRERDGKCVECSSTEQLQAHHVKSWHHYPDLRYDLDNGVTLCLDCHQKAHGRTFGFG